MDIRIDYGDKLPMAKRSCSLQCTKTERLKYLVAGLILLLIALVVVAADSEYPQLEPVRKLTNSCKSEIVSVYRETPHLEPARTLIKSVESKIISAYHNNPQLEPMRKLIRSFKGETGAF